MLEQEQTSPNHVQVLFPGPVSCVCVCVYAKIFNPSISNTPIVTVSAVSKTIEKV